MDGDLLGCDEQAERLPNLRDVLSEAEVAALYVALSAQSRRTGRAFVVDEWRALFGPDPWLRYWRRLAVAADRPDLAAKFPADLGPDESALDLARTRGIPW